MGAISRSSEEKNGAEKRSIMDYQYGQNNNNENNDYMYYRSEPYVTGPIPEEPKKKEKKKGRWVIPVCIILSLITGTAGGALGSSLVIKNNNSYATGEGILEESVHKTIPSTAVQQPTEAVQVSSPQVSGGMSVEQIAKQCLPSVVAITNIGETEIRSLWGTFTQESKSSGSGVIIGQTDSELLIVTNHHVVSGAEELSVLFSYQEDADNAEIASAKVKDYDENKDVAVIAIDLSTLSQETLQNIRVAVVGDSDKLVLGEQVVAIGNALGYGQSVTTGIVSALGRPIASAYAEDGDNHYIQTDTAINPGNSGGALFNMKGELVGINRAKIKQTDVEGVGYAIPISDINEDVQKMMMRETREVVEEGKRGYLGVTVSNVTSEINQTYDIPVGAYVSSVTAGSPAEKAGIMKGMVITEVEGKSIRTRDELREYLDYYAAGETVTLTVQVRMESGYEEREMKAVLCTAKEVNASEKTQEKNQEEQAPDQSGQSGQGVNPFGGFFPFFGQ